LLSDEWGKFSGGDRCLLAMRRSAVREKKALDSPWRHLVDGFQYAWKDRAVRRVLGLMAAATLAGMPALVLMPSSPDGHLSPRLARSGLLMGGMGIGAVVGTLLLARRTRLAGLPRVMALSGIAVGATYLAFAFSPSITYHSP
jgi:hypothetical protein